MPRSIRNRTEEQSRTGRARVGGRAKGHGKGNVVIGSCGGGQARQGSSPSAAPMLLRKRLERRVELEVLREVSVKHKVDHLATHVPVVTRVEPRENRETLVVEYGEG
eukprot:2089377-Prymnesium_polylepis.2